MDNFPEARVRKGPAFSFVWLVPGLCAAGLAAFAFSRLRGAGPDIMIHFPDAETLVAGKTRIDYLGVPVGLVTALQVDSDGRGVTAKARLDGVAAGLAREGATFIVAKPEVSFEGVRGLATIFAGSSLILRAGGGPPAREFKGYSDVRAAERDAPGLVLTFTAPRAGSLQEGDAVLARGVRVGAIEDIRLDSSGSGVVIRAKIGPAYARFVRANTVFWESSGVRARFGLLGAKVSMDSVQGLLRGGVSFATPLPFGAPAKPGAAYPLKEEPKSWEKWAPNL